ncbi:hypothetical protein JHE03_22985 [Pluralibacter gergoviae]|uniref:phage baseplate protein n=1 Tax=Pluralibacter gergoviae TaxID=61647 RepID=UPI00190D49C6|nr:hypothetical protein [Pluralibacter gergoviae]MBK4119152.1 hypothetical protein [Pluralibacter gergoviae]
MDILSALFHQQSRKIDILIPDVVITEKHSDALEITEHPVERSTTSGTGFVADHAYRRPSEVVMEIGFSGGGSLLDLLDTSGIGLSLGMSPQETYQQLLDLQRSRKPFSVTTGKKMYDNMLIKVLDVTTDRASENVLMATLTLRELITTETQKVSVAAKENMKEGANTSAVQNSGAKTPKPVTDESVLRKITRFFAGG